MNIPEGYKAIDAYALCGGCKVKKRCHKGENFSCCPSERDDKRLIIFIKDKTL